MISKIIYNVFDFLASFCAAIVNAVSLKADLGGDKRSAKEMVFQNWLRILKDIPCEACDGDGYLELADGEYVICDVCHGIRIDLETAYYGGAEEEIESE